MLDHQTDGGGDMAKDASETFRLSTALQQRMSKCAFACDKNKSEFVTSCIKFALPFFEADNSAVDTVEMMYKLRSKNDER